jgi:TRAP-type mannitol/chloroaromatic compound transport system permease small subunit
VSEIGVAFVTFGSVLLRTLAVMSPILLLPLAVLAFPRRLGPLGNGLSAGIDRVSGWAGSLAMAACVVLVVLQVLVIVLRYVFGLSYPALGEGLIWLFALIFMLGAAMALRDDAHVRVDILREGMSAKGRAGVDLAGVMMFLYPVCILILLSVRPSLTRSWERLEASREAGGLPVYFLFKTLIPVFALLLLAQGLSVALKAARTLREPY